MCTRKGETNLLFHMLLALLNLLIYYLVVDAHPTLTVKDYVPSTCFDLRHCRTIGNIVWSSLVTIFSCAFVAVHRNMPDPVSRWYNVALVRAGITVWALLVPELILFWAIQQWLVAGEVAKDINEINEQMQVATERGTAERNENVVKNASVAEVSGSQSRKNEGILENAVEDIAVTTAKGDQGVVYHDKSLFVICEANSF